ncbi:MAG: hypothetical protein COU28_00125 [Candidatus Magasanikbacteria bacterium CG10_big_fil_rev_8_21_14_0_10_36_16]|uniref:Probable DNA 3'-5' helicase RecG n=1 Tax=Candidatus Magasanikbacteria bacterium CG10_big_fil_rev_8_21_14_0_10_36_16 TaxID=1974645 RepID=A0A2H0TZR0_9BACT|nr:MAG: hypothetical protein COU28_00125 [Candidatus Magasanikbacteria bacterium CG10_big_fil_rev_8_21_14_0_10_36_16]
MSLKTKVTKLNRIGKTLEKRLSTLGIETVGDLLFYFPFRYEDYSEILNISNLQAGQEVTIKAKIELINSKRSYRSKKIITEALISDDTERLRVVWFGQPFIAKTLHVGDEMFFSGKIKSDMFGLQMTGPSFEKVKKETMHTARIVPIYSLTAGVTQKQIRFLVSQVIHQIDEIEEWLPDDVRDVADVMELKEAIRAIHFPENQDEINHAEKRLKFDELFILQLRAEMLRQSIKVSKAPKIKFGEKSIQDFVLSLPFELTKDQKVASWEIIQDLEKGVPMNRLLEGDVGSGKTVVAAMATLDTVLNNYQVAIMAPTEILAKQHYESFTSLLSGHDIKICLLTRSMRFINKDKEINRDKIEMDGDNKEKDILSLKQLSDKIMNGEVNVIIGTHALLSDKIKFKDLALVIVDEQHRFGVEQRASLIRGQTQTEADSCGNNDVDVGDKVELLYEDLTYRIRKCLFAVRKNLGLGHKEILYQNALEAEFKKEKLVFEKEKTMSVMYDGKKIGVYRPDFVVEDKIIIELKALKFIGKNEKTQVWTYLKGSNYKLALLANFSPSDVEIERIVYDEARENKKSALSQRKSALVPHFLSMTATPIPRSFALTIYGDLDLSIIKQMPKDRKVIKTRFVDDHNRQKAYDFIREQVKQGRQVFVICPLIEQKEKDENEIEIINYNFTGSQEKKSVLVEFEKLSKQIFPDLKVDYLHGKMPAQGGSASGGKRSKDSVMNDFKDGKIDILVSTSVVEVGVNIPNASVMMIEGAENFGLAQLHQFRGRVGRSSYQSYCFLFTTKSSVKSKERLEFFEKTSDGFALAEYDLEVRGPGAVYGVAQSGMMNLKIATMQDKEIIKLARDVARGMDFQKYPSLKKKVGEWEKSVHLE